PRIVVAPTYRRTRRTGIERLHLRLVGARAIFVVERRADPVADQSADGGARYRADDAAAAAAKLRADDGAGQGAHERAGALVRSGTRRIPRTGRQRQYNERNNDEASKPHPPSLRKCPAAT